MPTAIKMTGSTLLSKSPTALKNQSTPMMRTTSPPIGDVKNVLILLSEISGRSLMLETVSSSLFTPSDTVFDTSSAISSSFSSKFFFPPGGVPGSLVP